MYMHGVSLLLLACKTLRKLLLLVANLLKLGMYKKISPYFVLKILPNMATGHACQHKIWTVYSPCHLVATAYAAGLPLDQN